MMAIDVSTCAAWTILVAIVSPTFVTYPPIDYFAINWFCIIIWMRVRVRCGVYVVVIVIVTVTVAISMRA